MLECVVISSTHVEQRIPALVLPTVPHIVIAQHGVEPYTVFQQRRKRLLEILHEVTRTAVGIDVVAGGDRKIKGGALVRFKHLRGDVDLIAVPCSAVADY